MNGFLQFILQRAREKTTWLGMISLAGALGLAITPEQSEAIIAFGMALAGLFGVFTKEAS